MANFNDFKSHRAEFYSGILILVQFLFSCASSEIFVRPNSDFSKYQRVAVLTFQDFFSAPGSGKEVADILSFALLESGFNVIDRSETENLLREQGLYGQSGILNESTIPSVGKMLGVQAFLSGTVSEYSTGVAYLDAEKTTPMGYSNVTLTVKMIDTETGQVIWAGTCKGNTPFLQGQLAQATQKAVRNILSKLPLGKEPAQPTAKKETIGASNKSFASNLYGKILVCKNGLGLMDKGSAAGVTTGQKLPVTRLLGEGEDAMPIAVGEVEVLKVSDSKAALRLYSRTGFTIEINDLVVLNKSQ